MTLLNFNPLVVPGVSVHCCRRIDFWHWWLFHGNNSDKRYNICMVNLTLLKKDLHALGSPEKAQFLKRFFKTAPGEYAAGDQFIGVVVPNSRIIAKKYKTLPLAEVKTLLISPIHEERLVALFILIHQFSKGTTAIQKEIYELYLSHTAYINNWDLVDSSAAHIVGAYLADKPRDVLYSFARSELLWERRIAMIATLYYIKKNDCTDALKIAALLVHDTHDLIHKAVGWMLREVGERSRQTEEKFLKKHYKTMPRTMLRYAIEKFLPPTRTQYLQGLI